MVVKGKLTKINQPEKGESKAGKEWVKQSIVIDTGDQFNPEVCVSFFGDKTDLITGIAVGDELEVSINLSSREFKGKYYHNIDGWKIEGGGRQSEPAQEPTTDLDSSGDLPF